MEANVTVTMDTKDVPGLADALLIVAEQRCGELQRRLDLEGNFLNRLGFRLGNDEYLESISRVEEALQDIGDKVQQSRNIIEGLLDHKRGALFREAQASEGFSSFMSVLGETDTSEDDAGEASEVPNPEDTGTDDQQAD
jgi:hypothetical protein